MECEEGDEGCYHNESCADDDADCMEYVKCADDDQDCIAHGGWSDDGHDDAGDDVEPVEYDDGWSDDGWTSAAYASQEVQNEKSTPVWPFLLAGLVACVVGVMFVVSRRKRRSEAQESGSVSDGAAAKRKRVFNFGKKKQGALNEDFDNEDNYVEMSH